MSMIGSIQFQDLLKRRLQAIVHCFAKISESIAGSAEGVLLVEGISLVQRDIIVETQLDATVRFTVEEIRSSRQAGWDRARRWIAAQ